MKQLFILIFPLALTACGTGYNESFDCAPGRGVGCKSISMVDRLVDQEKLPSQIEENQKISPVQTLEINNQGPQKTVRVWIPDFKDKSGRIVEPQIIHEVVGVGYRPYFDFRPKGLPKMMVV